MKMLMNLYVRLPVRASATRCIGRAVRVLSAGMSLMCLMSLTAPAFAQSGGGLSGTASTVLQDIATALTAIGVLVCTIAIMWAGFRMMFQSARFGEIAHIFIGAMFVGGAATIAGVLLPGSTG